MSSEKKGQIVVINREKQSPMSCPAVSPTMKYKKNCPELKDEDFRKKVADHAPKVAEKMYAGLKNW